MAPVESTLSEVEVVFLDAGNTMLCADPPVEIRYAETAARHGISAVAAEIKPRFRQLWQDYSERRAQQLFTTDPAATRDFWRRFVADVFEPWAQPGRGFDAFFDELYDTFATQGAWKLYDDVLPTLDALRAQGLRLGVISNWDIRLPQLLDAVGLTPYFEAVLVSAEEGLEKPAAELFRRALQRFEIAPTQALHVGDSLEEDVRGARGVGLHAALIDRGQPLPFYVDAPDESGRDYLVLGSLLELVKRLG